MTAKTPAGTASNSLPREYTGEGIGRLLRVAIVAIVLAFTGITHAALTGVLARGQGDQFWLLRTETTDDPAKSPSTAVRRLADPVAGTWVASTRLAGRAVDAAPVGARLAVLNDAGDWRLVWDGGSVAGPVPPDGLTLRRLAAAGDVLLAVAEKVGEPDVRPVLLRWTEAAGWSPLGALPEGVDRATVALTVVGETAFVAWVDAGTIRVARREGDRWREPFRPLARGTAAAFVSGAQRPVVAVRTPAGRVAFWRADAVPPVELRADVDAPAAAEFTAVGPGLRVVSIENGRVQQTVIDDYGRGKSFGPDVVPDPPPAHAQRAEWVNLIVLTILTVVMLRNLRTADATPPTLAAGVRPAPLWRRAGAAVLDALPCIVAIVWVVSHFNGTPEELKQTPTRWFLPLFLSVLAYLGHVTISEVKFGRSLGKYVFRLRVVTTDGGPVPVERMVLRNLLRVLDMLVLPALLPLISPTGQRVGDLAAKTVVVADGAAAEAVPGEEIPS